MFIKCVSAHDYYVGSHLFIANVHANLTSSAKTPYFAVGDVPNVVCRLSTNTKFNRSKFFPLHVRKTRQLRKHMCESWLSDSLANKEVCVVFNL